MKRISLPTEFIDDLAFASSTSDVLNVVARWLPEITGCDRSSVALAAKDRQSLSVYAMRGNEAINLGVSLPIENTLAGHAFKSEEPIHNFDITNKTELDAIMLREAGLNSSLLAPMRSGNQCFGTLNIAHHDTRHFTEEDALNMQCLATWIASHIRIHEQAETDTLTQLLNRRAFNSVSAKVWDSFEREESTFVFCLLDLDHFKNVNDSFGHTAGDKTLVQIAETIRKTIRKTDYVARLGGEEFGVVLVDMPIEAASNWAERLRRNIEKMDINLDASTLKITSSIGVAEPSAVDLSFEAVYKRADAALYEAKETGRNLVTIGRAA